MAKRSRKNRKSKRTQTAAASVTAPVARTAVPAGKSKKAKIAEKAVDFVQDYYYVYNDMQTMLIVTLLMVAVMFGLSFVF